MATEVNLPALGESVTEGTVTRWLKQVGDQVAVDEPLLEVSTDKVDTEIPSPVAGTLLEIKANEDDTVEVGAVLAIVGDEGEGGGSGSGDSSEEAESETASETTDESASEGQSEEEAQQERTASEPQPVAADSSESAEAKTTSESADESSSGGGDSTPVTLPALGESVTEGTVTRWLKQVGDEVAVDEPLLEVSTDKVDTEIPSPVAGTLLEIKVSEDETVEVGAELALVGSGQPSSGGGGEEEKQPEPEAKEPEPEAKEPEPEAKEPEPEPEPEPQATEEQAPAQEKQPEPEREPAPAPSAPSGSAEAAGYVTPLVRKL